MDPSYINKTRSLKSDKVVFDTKEIEPLDYHPLPKPHYESYSATSIEKSNNYYIEEDVRSIKEEHCESTLSKEQKQYESYCKLYHFK